MTETVSTLEADGLAVDLMVVAARFVRTQARLVEEAEPAAVWRAMAILEEHGALRVSEFAAIDRCSQPSATAMLQRLEVSGAVTRVQDPSDGRAHLVSLTDEGRTRLISRRTALAAALGPRLAALTSAQRDQLAGAVTILDSLMHPTTRLPAAPERPAPL